MSARRAATPPRALVARFFIIKTLAAMALRERFKVRLRLWDYLGADIGSHYKTKRLFTEDIMSNRSKFVGLVEVARLAGVSPSTVSGVFRDTGEAYSVSPTTRARVLDAAARLDYRPNSLARAMRRRRFQQVGFLVRQPERTFSVIKESLSGVFDATMEANYHLLFIGVRPDFMRGSHALPQSFQEECIDCLVADSTFGFTPEMSQVLYGSRFPVVHINAQQATNAVYVDDASGAREATEYMIRKGHKRVVFFSYQRPFVDIHYSYDVRRGAYLETMSESGLTAREVCIPMGEHWARDTEAVFTGANRPDAIICYSDHDAVSVQRILMRLGTTALGDLDIIGFNGSTEAKLSPYPLTTMAIPWYELGHTAVEMALKLSLDKSTTELPSQVFRARLVEGEFGIGPI